jgi:transposase-like protein
MTNQFSPTSNGFAPRASSTRSSEIQPAPQRRTRSAAEKLRILQAYETAPSGTAERGALLRREGIYSSQISKWRKLRDQGKLGHLSSQRRGPKAAPRELLTDQLDALRKENARLQARLTRAEAIIDVQKKVAHLLGTSLPSLSADEL